VDVDNVELRVLGSLIEKQRTTPDVYPLSLNALRLACNQSTNRDPVVAFDEPTIRQALERLARRGWTRLASGPGSRAAKYRHLLDEALGLTPSEISVLAVLVLRGPQTIGEIKGRTERMYPFGSLADVESTLSRLRERDLAQQLDRRPGQKEERWRHLLGGDDEMPSPPTAAASQEPSGVASRPAPLEALEARVTALEAALERVVTQLGLGEGEESARRDG
jgi:uncharacterized protein YceH (UPF0502 family)